MTFTALPSSTNTDIIIKDSWVFQIWFILGELMLTSPSNLLYLPRNVIQENLLYDIPRGHSEADFP